MGVKKRRSTCPVACTLDILGDKWTMVVVRDMFLGASRFGDFLASPENIPTNILTDRLKRLENEGIVSRTAYQTHPVRYTYALTEMGEDLRPLIRAMVDWGTKYKKTVILKRA